MGGFFRHLLDAVEVDADFVRSSADLIQEVADHLVAVGGHAHAQAKLHHLSDHAAPVYVLPLPGGPWMRRDNQDENRATIRMRMRRRGDYEGRA